MTGSLMQSALWQTAGWVMLHFLWVGAVIGLVAAAGRWLLPKSPQGRYAFVLACFAACTVAPAVLFACLHIESPIVAAGLVEPEAADILAPAQTWSAEVPKARADLTAPLLEAIAGFLPLLWLIGTPCTLLLVSLGVAGSERLRRQSQRLDEGDVADRCRWLCETLRMRGHVAVGVCARLSGPVLVGIVKPMILLPPAALSGWSVEQLEMVLLHELAHVRRCDNLVNLLQRLVEAILFFHPVVWWLSAWIRLERELCCDRVVICATGKPRAYAATLAALAMSEPMLPAGALGMASHRLLLRIRRILNLEDQPMKVSTKLLGVAPVLLSAALVVGLYAQAEKPAPAPMLPVSREDAAGEQKADPFAPGAAAAPDRPKEEDKRARTISQPATVAAYQEAHLFSRVAGIVNSVTVNVGDRVKKGQVLVQLDVPEVELDLRQKQALLQQARAETNQAKSSVKAAQAALESARALVLEAEAGARGARANHDFRKKQLERLTVLLANKSIEPSIVDEADEKLAAARALQAASEAKWQAAKATVDENSAKVARAEADVQVAQAHVEVADASLHNAQALLQSARIVAPFDGVVTDRNVNVGDQAPVGRQERLLTVARTDLVRVVFDLPEADIHNVNAGTPATIQVHAFPNKQFEGKVARIAPAIDRRTGCLRVEIDLLNDHRLLPGMSGTVILKAGKQPEPGS